MGSSDSESEDERRVVRSAKDKAQEELRAVCNDIKVGTHVWPATLLVNGHADVTAFEPSRANAQLLVTK